MKKLLKFVVVFLVLLGIFYVLGPSPDAPIYNEQMPEIASITKLDHYIATKESKFNVRPDNEAQIIWADSNGIATEYVILYLHGFSASHKEGYPVHQNLSKHFGANLFLSRLAEHGLHSDTSLFYYTADKAWESAKEALVISNTLGKKVIIISTSTGGTLALKLAAIYPNRIHALINLSPNIRIKDPTARLLNNPWGKEIATLVFGKQRAISYEREDTKQYWDTLYSVNALVELEELMETSMTEETFSKINCPVLSLYYYKDGQNQDEVIDVSVIANMHQSLGTKEELKEYKALATPGTHVIASSYRSKDYAIVEKEIKLFCEKTLGMLTVANK